MLKLNLFWQLRHLIKHASKVIRELIHLPIFSGGGNGCDAQVNAVRNGNDVYQGNWPSNKYLNVYVIADAGELEVIPITQVTLTSVI